MPNELDDLMPNPRVWPRCSGCSRDYMLQRRGEAWVWAIDCRCARRRHNPAPPVTWSADGPVLALIPEVNRA